MHYLFYHDDGVAQDYRWHRLFFCSVHMSTMGSLIPLKLLGRVDFVD